MMEPSPIRVVVVDDHDLVRMGITAALATLSDMELVGQGVNGLEAVQLCEQFQPDVLLLDLHMPDTDGLAAIPPIRQCSPNTHIVVLSNFIESDLFKEVMAAGAGSYLAKDVSLDELARAIRAAVKGEPTITNQVVQQLVAELQQPATPSVDLTAREHEVLVLIAQGQTNGQIAQHLYIALPTVKRHISSILDKLQVKNRAEAVVFALKHNFAGPTDSRKPY